MCHENIFYSSISVIQALVFNFAPISFLTKSLKTMFPKWERWFYTVQKYPCLATDGQ